MADKNLPSAHLSDDDARDNAIAERRAFLKRAALAGIPVLIATVPGRVAWANSTGANGAINATCGGSLAASQTASTQTIC